jgi:hypothetical protein
MTDGFGKNRDQNKEVIGIIRVCANPLTLTCASGPVDTITTHVAFTKNNFVNQHTSFKLLKNSRAKNNAQKHTSALIHNAEECFR